MVSYSVEWDGNNVSYTYLNAAARRLAAGNPGTDVRVQRNLEAYYNYDQRADS